ncbi:MAG TPA: hypothetical protein VIR58_02375 [Acidimicrobiales bacterium]
MRRRWPLVLLPVLVPMLALVACSDGDGADAAGDPELFCDRLDRLVRNDPFLAFGERATNDEIAMAFDALVQRADELVEVAPPEARAAARTYAESTRALDDLLAEVGHDGTEVDARAYREQEITYKDSAQRLERHLESEC